MKRRWLDPRAIFLSALLALAAALPSITTSVERRDCYFFDVTLTSTTFGSTQLFWDLGRGFTEYDSSRQPIKIEPHPVVYRFMMPMGTFRALRLDPVDGSGQFTFSRAQIVDREGKIIKVFLPEDLVPAANIRQTWKEGGTLHVSTDPASNDPVLQLRLEQPLKLGPTWRIWRESGWPVVWKVFALGFVLGLPAVATRLSVLANGIGRRCATQPLTTLAATAALAVAIQCHPVIFAGRSFASPNNGGHMLYEGLPALPGDTDPMSTNTGSSDTGALLFQHLYYPMVQRDALQAGEWPLWNRYSLSGEPLLGQGQSMFGDPLNFITIAADGAAWAWDLRFLLARWIMAAALGGTVWLLTRHLGAAALTSLSAGFLGYFTFRLVHPANFSVAYSPLILLAWSALPGPGTGRSLALRLAALVGANWMVLTSGTVKEAYMLMVGLNFAGALLLCARPESAGRRIRLLSMAAAAGAGFVLIAAPAWQSFLMAWSHSMTGYDTPQARTLPLAQVIGFFDDIFYRHTSKDENVVAPALNFLFLAGALWWALQPRGWRKEKIGLALLAASLPPFALAFGLIPASIIVRIPFVGNIVHVDNTFSCVLLSLVAVLAGLGFRDAWTKLASPDSSLVLGRYWCAGATLLLVFIAATWSASGSPFFWGYTVALAIAFVVLPLGLRWGLAEPSAPGPLWVVLVICLPLFGWRHGQHASTAFNHYTFVPGPRSNLHATSPAIERVKQDATEPGRVNGWNSVLYASYNTVPRLEGVYGVDAVRSRHYHELADALGLQRVWNWDWPNREAQSLELVRKYDLYNVTHWLATPRPAPHDIAGLTSLAQADLNVYRSPTAWPRAFYVDRATRYETAADFAALLMQGDGRPFAAFQGSDLPASLLTTLAQPPHPRVVHPAKDYRLTPNSTQFTLEAPGPGLAVLGETYYLDDFAVTLNGQPVDYHRVNHAFKAVLLPAAGTYHVAFVYRPKGFTYALWAAGLGLVGLLLGAAWLWRQPQPLVASAIPHE